MLDFLKLGRWLDHGQMGERAVQTAQSVATRWDVIQGERKPGQPDDDDTPYIKIGEEWFPIPPDLRDTRPRLYRTAPDPVTGRQGRVAGRILPDDLVSGSPSSAVPILFAAVPFVGFLIYCASALDSIGVIAPVLGVLGLLLAFISNATQSVGKGWVLLSALAALLPLKTLTDHALSMTGDWDSVGFAVKAGVIVGLALLFGGLRNARTAVGGLLLLAIVLLLSSVAPDALKPAVLLIPACALPWAWAFFLRRARGIELAVYGTTCNWEDSANGLGHVDARRAQTLRAAKEYRP